MTGWPTASKVHFVTYKIDTNSNPVAGTQLDCYGIVSGSTIGSLTVVDGTDTGNAVGDVVEMLPTAAWGQDLSDGLLVAHNRDGSLQTVAVAKGGTGATTFTDAGVLLGNGTSAIQVTSAGSSGQVLTSNGAGVDPTFQTNAATGVFTLLKAEAGSTTSASAENVSSVNISGLTALDTLVVYFNYRSATQATSAPHLSHVTDSNGIITYLNGTGGAATAGDQYFGDVLIMTPRWDNTVYNAASRITHPVSTGGNDASVAGFGKATSLTTNFTGSWTLGFRHGGVTSGGTFTWSWRVYKIAGQ